MSVRILDVTVLAIMCLEKYASIDNYFQLIQIHIKFEMNYC